MLKIGYALDNQSTRTFLNRHPDVYPGRVRSVNTGPFQPEVIAFEWESTPGQVTKEVHPEVYFWCDSLSHFLELQNDLTYHESEVEVGS